MKRTTAAVYCEHGRPFGYTLYAEGQEVNPRPVRGTQPVITTFEEAYSLFETIRQHFRPDGTPLEG